MKWPIRNQVLIPVALILLAAVAVTAFSAAFVAARRVELSTVAQLNQVIDTLGRTSFPYSENVLLQMRGLSGAEFVALDERGRIVASTLPQVDDAAIGALTHRVLESRSAENNLATLAGHPAVALSGERYFAATVTRSGPFSARKLLVLYPETSLRTARREATLPPLIVGSVTIVLMLVAVAWLANRLSRRIRSVQRQVADIAAGDFRTVTVTGPADEIRELIASVNTMSARLEEMQQTIARTERARLLGQLAGGLAHQLRNAVTGASLAVQIHQRRCPSIGDDSLEHALRQLQLTEEQVKGLLSLGRAERPAPVPCRLTALIEDVAALVGPACQHGDVRFVHDVAADDFCEVADSQPIRTAVLNLTLNAIEAAGAGGRVELQATADEDRIAFDVTDTGPGPPQELAAQMFDAFATGKPEGVGLGLALAKQTADEQGGRLEWERRDGVTLFRLSIPQQLAVSRQHSAFSQNPSARSCSLTAES